MTATQLVILAFFTPVALIGITSFAIELIVDRSKINKSAPSWTAQTAKVHRPNFAANQRQMPKPVQKNDQENLFEEEISNDIPDFNSLADSAAVEEIAYSTTHQNEPQLNEVDLASLQQVAPPNEEAVYSFEKSTPDDDILPFEIEASKKEEKQEYEHSIPTKDMEDSIQELIEATSDIPEVFSDKEETQSTEALEEVLVESNNSDIPLDTEVPPEQEEELLENYTAESPLGINYIEVYKAFGKEVADKVTASPECALERGVDYVMCGEIKGEFLNCFGETIKVKGLPKDYESKGEFVLLKGQFVTAELFHVITCLPAIEASKQEGFEVLNVAYS